MADPLILPHVKVQSVGFGGVAMDLGDIPVVPKREWICLSEHRRRTGIANAIIVPEVFLRNRYTIVDGKFLLLEGRLQHEDNVISVKVSVAHRPSVSKASTVSHNFH